MIALYMTIGFIVLALLVYLFCRRARNKEVLADAEKLEQMALGNCTVLQRNDKTHKKLRSKIKKLCNRRWRHSSYRLNVINVGVVTNVSLRQRYERAYQAAQSAVQPSYLETQSAPPPSYLEAVNMAYCPPSVDENDETSAVSIIVTEFESGVLRQGESYLFYTTDVSELKAVLESSMETAFSGFSISEWTPRNCICLGEFSSYGTPTPDSGTDYMFVVRAMIDAETVTHVPDPSDRHASRIYKIFNPSEVLPEFMISYNVWEPSSD